MQTQVKTADTVTPAGTASTASTASTSPRCPRTGLVALKEELTPVAAIASWLSCRDADDFPYEAVVAEYHRVGKHFVATELLEAMAGVRAVLSEVRGSATSVRLLDRFLDAALDKWDGRYANPTYLGLSLLPLSTADDLDRHITAAERRYDRLLVQLIADAARFEVVAADGTTELLPRLRPEARTSAKRCRLALQVAGPAARRLGLDDGVEVADPIAGARRLWANLAADLSSDERRRLRLTMLPVSLVHDEYQFIRVLQSFEATFALIALQLRAAVRALADGASGVASERIRAAERALREAAPLWSLVATMQLDAFQTFREFTDGASAIQSRNYKIVESVCRQPDPSRLDSAAYHSVPEVRQQVLAGQETVDDAFAAAHAAGRLSADDVDDLEQSMGQFAATLLRWRRTHYQLATRMLGEHTGTGYTEGASYLKSVQTIPVFSSLATGEIAETRDLAGDDTRPRAPLPESGHGRCPFAAGRVALAMNGAGT